MRPDKHISPQMNRWAIVVRRHRGNPCKPITTTPKIHPEWEWESGRECRPEDLDGAPQVEHKEDHRLALHLLQTTKDDEENYVSARHLLRDRKETLEVNNTIIINIYIYIYTHFFNL